ncbi:helix-turn-helix domain-containing protein [Streptomyces cheonanensis]|uniref:Helix-turn-helix domain-containing protein n=1 Tax=Streptomyces cheonanensis TaxID=312720 RepID=A0ABN2UWV5_9ACTN
MPRHAPRAQRLDAQSLLAIAHPLRMRLLGALREHGPATASHLAERLGESSGATSYHLRQLAVFGFVEDDPDRGTGRERWWRSAYDSTLIDDTSEMLDHADPRVRGALHLYQQEVAAHHALEQASFLGSFHEWPAQWREASDLSDFTLQLTARQAQELVERLHAVIAEYGTAVQDTEETQPVRVHLHAFPRPPEPLG